jgi:hypothetical protein
VPVPIPTPVSIEYLEDLDLLALTYRRAANCHLNPGETFEYGGRQFVVQARCQAEEPHELVVFCERSF